MTVLRNLLLAALAGASLAACSEPIDPEDPLGLRPLLEPAFRPPAEPIGAAGPATADVPVVPATESDATPRSTDMRALLVNGETAVDTRTEWRCGPRGTAADKTSTRLRLLADGTGRYGSERRSAAIVWALEGTSLSFELPDTGTLVYLGDLCLARRDRLHTDLVTSAGETASLVCHLESVSEEIEPSASPLPTHRVDENAMSARDSVSAASVYPLGSCSTHPLDPVEPASIPNDLETDTEAS